MARCGTTTGTPPSSSTPTVLTSPASGTSVTEPIDTLGRPLRDLRISVTDRCNFRCTYCMPKEVFGRDYEFLGADLLLTFEEITRVGAPSPPVSACSKVRLTGGEPLLRRDLPDLVAMLAGVDGIDDLTLTTNGSLLARDAAALAAAGLDRVTVSLDSLDDATFMAMNDVGFPVSRVLEGIDAAAAAGLGPIKVNVVVKRGVNDDDVVAMAATSAAPATSSGSSSTWTSAHSNGWRLDDVVPAAEILSADRTPRSPWSRSPRTTRARSPTATGIATARARSGSSPRSPSPSARPAPGPGCRPRAASTPACSPPGATTCGRCCATAPPTTTSRRRCARSGRPATTATRRSAPTATTGWQKVEMSYIGG